MSIRKPTKTARLSSLDTVETPTPEMSEPEDAGEVAEAIVSDQIDMKKVIGPTSGFNALKTVPEEVVKGERSYIGPATELMNDIHDAVGTQVVEYLPGWERVSHMVAKACEKLEAAGWKKG